MKQKYTKTSKSTLTVTWDITVQDDDGRSVAYITGLLDDNHPKGNINMVVRDKEIYDANKADVDSFYDTFVAEMQKEITDNGDKLLVTSKVESGNDEFSTVGADEAL